MRCKALALAWPIQKKAADIRLTWCYTFLHPPAARLAFFTWSCWSCSARAVS